MAELYFFGNSTPSQMMGMALLTENQTILIDGGTRGDAAQISDLLAQHGRTTIDAWFFTHPHHDHIGAFVELCERCGKVPAEQIFYHFPTHAEVLAFGTRTEHERVLWERFFAIADTNCNRFFTIVPGDAFAFDDVTIRVLRVYNPAFTANPINNSSTVYRIDSAGKRVLVLGDLGVEGGNELMDMYPAEVLSADYTQLAHHGQAGVSKEFYAYIRPNCCLWATPDWLWDNCGPDGPGSGPFHTLMTRAWMEELGVKKHIIGKDGTALIQL
ncbi:MAG: MBL fold metallo-hydrolase [Clostridia bacterium]|nr:MBL fold metallo-hydrolase [Clostridia bacterium]